MKNKKLWLGVLLIAVVAAGMFAQPQKVSIDMRFTVPKLDAAKDYFNWTADGKKVNDKFSATQKREHNGEVSTGASVAGSTEGFDAVFRDTGASTGKKTFPQAVRHLFLFPISSPDTGPNDGITVTKSGNKITIRFFNSNRGAFEIVSDDKGQIDMANCARFVSSGVTESVAGVTRLKAEYVQAGKDRNNLANADWSKITQLLKPDVSEGAHSYTGKLNVAYSGNVLTVKGDLTLKK